MSSERNRSSMTVFCFLCDREQSPRCQSLRPFLLHSSGTLLRLPGPSLRIGLAPHCAVSLDHGKTLQASNARTELQEDGPSLDVLAALRLSFRLHSIHQSGIDHVLVNQCQRK